MSTNLNSRVADVIEKAHSLLANGGWISGWFRKKVNPRSPNPRYQYCAVGAIRAAAPGPENAAVRRAAYEAIAKTVDPDYSWLTPMNRVIDHNDGTSYKTVSKSFKDTIKRLRERN